MLNYYFEACRSVMKGNFPHMKILYYADLFCGDGEIVDKKTTEKSDSPFLTNLMGIGVKQESLDIRFLLNDIDKDAIIKLRQKINLLGTSNKVISFESKDANEYIATVLTKIPRINWSIFFLDPYKYGHLKWSTIVKISEHAYSNTRKPEMIINLPIYSLLMGNKAKDYNGIDEFFGNHNWADRIKKYEENNSSSRPQVDAFLDEFCDALKRFGYLVEYQEVTSIETNAPVYYMVFAVSNDNAHAIVKRMMQGITKAKEKWIAETQAKITKVDGVGLSGRTLSGWVPATKRKLTDWMD